MTTPRRFEREKREEMVAHWGVRTAWWSALRLESGPLTVGSNGHAVERRSLIAGSGGLIGVTTALVSGRRPVIVGSALLTVATSSPAPAGPSRPFPLMRDATTSRSFARARSRARSG